MQSDLVKIEPLFLFPTAGGTAMFLLGEEKVVLMFIDRNMGATIIEALKENDFERPQTHDLFQLFVESMGGEMKKVVLVDEKEGIFHALAEFQMENEVLEKKIVQIDCRPSDCVALAVRMGSPMYCAREVWQRQDDKTHVLRFLEENFNEAPTHASSQDGIEEQDDDYNDDY